MGTLQAALEEALAALPDDEWDALQVRVRGPLCEHPIGKARKRRGATGVVDEGVGVCQS